MSPNTRHSNLAARMGRWSANHWKTATFGWLALVVVSFGIGGMVGTKNPNPNTQGPASRVGWTGFCTPTSSGRRPRMS